MNEKIDHRTLAEQGINRIPQIHLGAAVTAMMKRGIVTEKEKHYRQIESANRNIHSLEFHLELLERMESIYKNSPELDPTNDLSKSTQQVSVAPTIESQQEISTRTSHDARVSRASVSSSIEIAIALGDYRRSRIECCSLADRDARSSQRETIITT